MLLKFACSNYKSILEKVEFSFVAGPDDTFAEKLIPYGISKVSRASVIYGANGSGKSNFISSLLFMKNLVKNSITNQPGQRIFQAPHKLATANEPSEFSIQFVRAGIRYAYGFSIVEHFVADEYLYYFPERRKVKIFDRKGLHITPGSRYKKDFEVSLGVLKENRLFLSCAANYTNLKEIEAAFLFFSDEIVGYNRHMNNWMEYSINLMQKSPESKALFLKLLHEFRTGIEDIDVKLEKAKMNVHDVPPVFSEEIRAMLAESAHKVETKIKYKEFETDLMTEESDGIKKLFELLCPIIDILQHDKILICDELEIGLHETLVYKIVEMFQNAKPEKNAQLLFTTHDTSILRMNLFRRDQIWFTQQTKGRATDLYSLLEIRNVRKSENIEKGYISGKYGAIPMFNPGFIESFMKETEKPTLPKPLQGE